MSIEMETFDYAVITKIYYKFSYYLCCSPYQLVEETEKEIGEKYTLRRNVRQNVLKLNWLIFLILFRYWTKYNLIRLFMESRLQFISILLVADLWNGWVAFLKKLQRIMMVSIHFYTWVYLRLLLTLYRQSC